ncbi:MAG: M24 family metallopeptidase [Candidatus Humimicrobiaceae bacterium]
MISERLKELLPAKFNKLIREGTWEGYGEEITGDDYKERVARTQKKVAGEGYDALLVFGDCYRMSNIRWLVDYRTIDGIYPQPELIFLTPKENPVLFIPGSEIRSAHEESAMKYLGDDIREIRKDLGGFLKEYNKKKPLKNVALSGSTFCDLEIYNIFREALPDSSIKPCQIVEYFKSIKTEKEIRTMKRAGQVADYGSQMLYDCLEEGITEKELQSLVYASMFASGAHCIAFDIMIQSGSNLFSLFKRPTDRKITSGEMVMMDHGCRINGYCSDSARTFAFGNVPKEQRELMEALNEAFEIGLENIKAGITGGDADAILRKAFGDKLSKYVVSPSAGRIGPHGTGMDPEEELPIIGPDSKDVLVEGQTFAYELSVIKDGLTGVRTEDPVVVRKDGLEAMTNFPRNNYKP